MAKRNLMSLDDLPKLLHSLTPEQWVTFHLLYSVFLQILKENGVKEVDNPELKKYLVSAKYAVRDSVKNAAGYAILTDLILANKSLFEGLQDATKGQSEENMGFGLLFTSMLGKVASYCVEDLGGKTIKECFPDIVIKKDQYPKSPTAEKIVEDFLLQLDGEVDKEFRSLNLEEAKSGEKNKNDIPKSDSNSSDHDGKKQNKRKPCEPKVEVQKSVEEDKEEEDDGLHPYLSDWEKLKDVLVNLPIEKALLFHAVTLLFCKKFLKWDWFTKYQKSVLKAFSAYRGKSSLSQQKMALNYANGAFVQLKDEVLDYIFNGHDYRAVALKNDLFTLSTDLCLKDISTSITSEKAQKFLKDILVFKDGISVSREMEAYAFSLYLSADQEYQDMYGKAIEDVHLGDDWTDFEEDDDEWFNKHYGYSDEEEEEFDEDEDEQPHESSEYEKEQAEIEKQLDSYMEKVATVLQEFDNERDLVFHLINIKMITHVVKPRIYAKYLRAVRSLISNYKEGKSNDTVSERRKKADDIFLSRYRTFLKDSDCNVQRNKIDEFYLLSDAFSACVIKVLKMTKGEVSRIVDSLIFNDITQGGESKLIQELAQNILRETHKEILSEENQ